MSRAIRVSLIWLSAASLLAGCASAPVQTASGYAGQGADAIYRTGSDVYAGVGTAAKRPFQDLNMMQDPIPIVLLRAELDPYSVKGLTSCEVVTNRVAELDLALGPDLDAPADRPKSKVTEDAGLAAAAALEAAAAAAEGFMPVRSVVKRVSGASKYEAHVKHAVLAGTERRTFLKAIGVMHNCGWPAAPLTLTAEQAKVVTIWGPPSGSAPMPAVVQANVPVVSVSPAMSAPGVAVQASTASVPSASVVGGARLQTASLAQAASPAASTPSQPLVEAASFSGGSTPTLASAPVAPLPAAKQTAAPSVVLVSNQDSASAPGARNAYSPGAPYLGSPSAASPPWASPPPGGR